jgi:hypothetical protein
MIVAAEYTFTFLGLPESENRPTMHPLYLLRAKTYVLEDEKHNPPKLL